jgi:hypothetical protein
MVGGKRSNPAGCVENIRGAALQKKAFEALGCERGEIAKLGVGFVGLRFRRQCDDACTCAVGFCLCNRAKQVRIIVCTAKQAENHGLGMDNVAPDIRVS